MYHVKDLVGQKFGKLTVLSRCGSNGSRQATWNCICDCGNYIVASGSRMIHGYKLSCGCYNHEIVSLPSGQATINKMYYQYGRKARRRNLDFDISLDDFKKLVFDICFYCGCSPSRFWKLQNGNGGITYNGIDRVNNAHGYIKENVVTCCSICNYAKREMSYGDFLSWVSRIYTNLENKGLIIKSTSVEQVYHLEDD